MTPAQKEKDSVKTNWINIQVSAPIIVFISLPIIFLSFAGVHGFKDDIVTKTLLVITGLVTLVFLYLVICKPENLTLDGSAHLAIKKDETKRKSGGNV